MVSLTNHDKNFHVTLRQAQGDIFYVYVRTQKTAKKYRRNQPNNTFL